MTSIPPLIEGNILTYHQSGQPAQLLVGTSDWYAWLSSASTFTFHSVQGTFTARKERAGSRRGGEYWKAYRRRHGKLSRVYLGKSEELTLEQLKSVAVVLASKGEGDGSLDVPGRGEGTRRPSEASPITSAHLRRAKGEHSPHEAALLKPRLASLPVPLTALIGREQEMRTICDLLRHTEVRLLTITGTGGVGKTRLALEVAGVLRSDFPDGTCFVPLAPVSDPTYVMAAIAQALGLWEAGALPQEKQVHAVLHDRHLLLLLDNFEHLLEAAPHLAALLASCPRLSLLVTSRAALHLSGEQEFPVPPLALPDLTQLPEPQTLAQKASVHLFVLRAQAIQPAFALTAANARTIADICVRLDGLPLAIELAAARSKLLPPQALLTRLSHRLQVLTGGPRDLPSRQQTLRNTLQWSYDLLSQQEQRLFRWLSIFVGGCTLEAAEAVCQGDSDQASSVLEGVASLLDKSLLQQTEWEGEQPRLLLLETIREYARECLSESGELEAAQRAHAAYYLQLAEEAEPYLVRAEQVQWFERLERELDNLRAVFQWAEMLGNEEAQLALRLGSALEQFWIKRGYMSEGRSFLERALARSKAVEAPLRGKALFTLGWLTWFQDDYRRVEQLSEKVSVLSRQLADRQSMALALTLQAVAAMGRRDHAGARSLFEQALALLRACGESWNIPFLLTNLGRLALYQGEESRAAQLLEESLVLFRAVGDKGAMAYVHFYLARARFNQGDLVRARTLLEESLPLYQEVGHKLGMAYALSFLGQVVFQQGEVDKADILLNESVRLHRAVGDRRGLSRSLLHVAGLATVQRDYTAAHACYEESLTIASELGLVGFIASGLKGLGIVAVAQGQPIWAAQLWGAAENLRESRGLSLSPATYDHMVAVVRSQLGESAFEEARAVGRALTPAQALASHEAFPPQAPQQGQAAPGSSPTAPPPPTRHPSSPAGLTAREVEVLRLVAQGLSDAQVAEQLIVSPRTVNWHLSSIYSKLQVSSRAAATRYAMEHHLV